MISSKGMETEQIFGWIIKIVLALLLVVIISLFLGNSLSDYAEGEQTRGSAFLLKSAIDDVYRNAVVLENPGYSKRVNITLPNSGGNPLAVWRDSSNINPKWILYSGLSGDDVVILSNLDFFEALPQHCTNICYGYARRENLPEMEFEAPTSEVEDFWLLNPCRAEVEVYYDDEIKLKLHKNSESDDGNNFCCINNDVGNIDYASDPVGIGWPDSDKAFNRGGRECFE